MSDLTDVRTLLNDEHGLAVVSTVQADGRILTSVVNCGIHAHPVTGVENVAFVSAGRAARLAHIRAGSPITITVRRGWQWAGVAGPATLIGLDDPIDGVDTDALRLVLRSVFQAAGGTHDDFDEYDRVMVADRRAAVFVAPERILGNR